MSNKKNTNIFKFTLVILITCFIFFVCLFCGSTGFSLDVLNQNYDSLLLNLRLPRVLCCALVGASLSICGASMQGLLRNPLADGTTLGVSSGASVGAIIAIIFTSSLQIFIGVSSNLIIFVFAILFSLFTFLFIIFISIKIDKSFTSNSIILVGIVITMLANSIISLLIALFPESAKTMTFWTMGSFVSSNLLDCAILGFSLIIFGIVLISKVREINIISFGEAQAQNLGVDVLRTKILILISVSVLVGISVSICGTIAFVGLIVPHIVRLVVGNDYRKLLPISIFAGASFLMIADLLSRIVFVPKELPIGVITSIIGVVFFILIFVKLKRSSN